MVEVDFLHQAVSWQQSMSSYISTEALEMQTSHALTYLFPNLGSVEITQGHHVSATKEDTDGIPVPHTIITTLLGFTDGAKALKVVLGPRVGAKGHPLHHYRNLT